MLSLFMTFGAYLVAKMLFVGAPLYDRLVWLMPVYWWNNVVGKALLLGIVWAMIDYRLKSEARTWAATGWGALNIRRDIAWGVACAALVLVVDQLLLTSTSNSAGVAKWGTIIGSSADGKIAGLLSIGLLTGILEELVYRGAFLAFSWKRASAGLRGRIPFILTSALFFAAMHGLSTRTDYAVYTLIGAVFASTLAISSSLRAVMLAHVLVNSVHVMGWGYYLKLPNLR